MDEGAERLDSQYVEEEDADGDDWVEPVDRSVPPALLWTGAIILALMGGIAAFALTGGSGEDPEVAVTPVEVPVLPPAPAPAFTPTPRATGTTVPPDLIGQQVADVVSALDGADLIADVVGAPIAGSDGIVRGEVLDVQPPPGSEVGLRSVIRVTAAVAPSAPPSDPLRTPDPIRPPRVLVPAPGDPAGSGCTPGPGALPDGQWIGYVAEGEPGLVRFDLVCFNSTTGAVTNTNTALREVPVAGDAVIRCGTLDCAISQITPATLSVIEVREGVARHVQAGVGTSG